MPLTLTWQDAALRLLLTVVSGSLIGWNRTERGRAAGLRTMILVSTAACLSMLLVNALLAISGKIPESFVQLDLMRLPLGVLSGMGFIGAGAIMRRENMVVGVTTAATLWFATVLGLCFGGGKLGLGGAGLAIGLAVLVGLHGLETRLNQEHQAKLEVVTSSDGPGDDEIRGNLEAHGIKVDSIALLRDAQARDRKIDFTVHWDAAGDDPAVPSAVKALAERPGVVRIQWTPGP